MTHFLQKLYDLEKRKRESNPTEYSENLNQFVKISINFGDITKAPQIEMVNYFMAQAIKSLAPYNKTKKSPLIIKGEEPNSKNYTWTSCMLLGQSIPDLNHITYRTIIGSMLYPVESQIERESGLLWIFTPENERPFKSFKPDSLYNQVFKNNINEEWLEYFLNSPLSTLRGRYSETSQKLAVEKPLAKASKRIEAEDLTQDHQRIEAARLAEERERMEAERLVKIQQGETHGLIIFNMVSQFDVKTADIRHEIEQGADINYKNQDGYTSLMRAVDSNNERIAEYLLRLGANPLLKNKYNETASQLASEESAIYEKLKGYELIFLTYNNDLRAIQLMINSTRVNVNFREKKYGYSPLLISIEANQQEITKYFLSINADVYATLSDGRGVMELASNNDIKKLLAEHIQTLNDTYDDTREPRRSHSNSFF